MYTAPQQCPTCQSALEVRELACPTCATVVRGRWAASPFGRLSADQAAFLTIFVRARGNLSDVERTLGVSYPTVRAKLDEVIGLLGEPAPAAAPPPPAGRQALLEAIARGDLSVDEGLTRLRVGQQREEKS
jgi:hypothetical protein